MRFALLKLGLMFFLACTYSLANVCLADNLVERADGSVVVDSPAHTGDGKEVGSKLVPGSIISTGPNGRAVVKLGEKGYIIIDKNSKVKINDNDDHAGFLRQITGIIYYAFNALHNKNDYLNIQTSNAVVGIRGTRFLIADTGNRKELGVRKGMVSITSLKQEFEIHRKTENKEFEAFKLQGKAAVAKEKDEFEAFKSRSVHEFVEYKREFTLGVDRMVSFEGNKVTENTLSGETKKDMKSLESYGDEWLSRVRD
jgi:FecR protein